MFKVCVKEIGIKDFKGTEKGILPGNIAIGKLDSGTSSWQTSWRRGSAWGPQL